MSMALVQSTPVRIEFAKSYMTSLGTVVGRPDLGGLEAPDVSLRPLSSSE